MSASPARRVRPRLEPLEGRRLPATFTVTNLLDDGSPGCLRSRVLAANDHPGADTVAFKPGLSGTVHLTAGAIPITDSLTVSGPGSAKVAVDGNAAGRIFTVDNGTGGADLNVTIRGLELRNGNAPAGGAIFSAENLTLVRDVIDANQANASGAISAAGNLTLKQCTISGNTAATNVGGVYFGGTTLTVSRSTISGNTATSGRGGGLYVYFGNATIDKSVIAGNSSSKEGGGVFVESTAASLTVTNSTISGNQSGTAGQGGGLESLAGETTIANCTVADNVTGGYGGGVLVGGTATITGCTVRDNTALFAGGGVATVPSGSFVMSDSTVSGNSAPAAGGGLFVRNGGATITGCTFAGNGSDRGGGMFLDTSGVVNLRNSTLSGNEAQSDGGAIATAATALVVHSCTIAFNRAAVHTANSKGGGISAADGTVSLESSIVARNTAGTTNSDLSTNTATPFTAVHCLIGAAGGVALTADATTTQLIGIDPMLAPLANSGGPTQTHALLAGSPCVNQGSNPDDLTYDQRGRPFKRQRGKAVDIGAFELM